jgi:hypothetical protein
MLYLPPPAELSPGVEAEISAEMPAKDISLGLQLLYIQHSFYPLIWLVGPCNNNILISYR